MPRHIEPKKVEIYEDESGKQPFAIWLKGLRDPRTRRRIINRIQRLEQGNYGDCAPIGEGLLELRMFFGPGYRVYFGEASKTRIILLCGGIKDTQQQDIEQAKTHWKEFKSHG